MLGKLLGMTFGFKVAALASAASLALGLAGGMKLQSGAVQKAKAQAVAARTIADGNYKAAMAWKASRDASEALRGQEASASVAALTQEQSACTARVAAARASQRRLAGLMSRPPRLAANGCPVERLWMEAELRPVLQPEAR